jgi:ferric-dicitrate binding protein FerR (iron transport regulator)
MKANRDSQQYSETLARYLSGEMGGAELRAFEEEIAVSEESKNRIDKMKKQWSAMKEFNDPAKPDTRQAWDKLHHRLRDENLIPGQMVASKNRLVSNWVRVAAAILMLLGISAVLYLNSKPKPAIGLVQINTVNDANTLVKTLADGSVIYIAQNSLFSFPEEFQSESRSVELKGEAFFDITPDKNKPFIIETDEVMIQVLGTTFNVKTQNGNDFMLFVDRGKVKVTLKNNPSASQLVVAGEKITSVKNKLVKSKYVPANQPVWYRQRMHFKDETLLNIITVLNRNFNTTFVLAEKELGNQKMTATFHNETAETMTELICATLNLKSHTVNGSVVLSGMEESAKPD